MRLTTPFYLGACEVTQAEYVQVIGENPSHFRAAQTASAAARQEAGQLPVENVSWDDAQEFCNRLSGLYAEKSAGRVYRLPSEAQWEYACRAGTATAYLFDDDPTALQDYAWFGFKNEGTTHAVGLKRGNAWQLYDMLGNVYEWCADFYDPAYYAKSPPTDPPGPAGGLRRVIRGGSWFGSAAFCRPTARVGAEPDGGEQIGFRVLCEITGGKGPRGDPPAKQ